MPDRLVGEPVLAIVVAAFAEPDRAERLVEPLRALGPAVDAVAPMPYTALQSMIDAGNPHGMQNLWKAGFIDDLTDDAVRDVIEHGAGIPSPLTVVLLQPLGGAYGRVDEHATALSHRDAGWVVHALSLWADPADTPVNRAWTEALAAAMAPYGHGVAHPNYVSEDAGDRVSRLYGDETYERLVAVKRCWDPDNVFALNQNIRP
jgi:FAD/FMN-containing dehydrogenase